MAKHDIKKFKGTSTTIRKNHRWAREVDYYTWKVTARKKDMRRCGFWVSNEVPVYFVTIPGAAGTYCDLKRVRGDRAKVRGIHKVIFKKGNCVDFLPYLGKDFRLEKFERSDPDTELEYFPENKLLRVHYPPGFRTFQLHFYMNQGQNHSLPSQGVAG